MKPPLRIALIVPTVSWYDRELIDGIAAYSREHGPWRLVLQADTTRHRVEPWVRQWKPDGVLARITGARMAKEMRGLGLPVVDLLEESGSSGIPRIVCDDRAVVQRAVDHLLDRHLRHFAHVGRSDVHFSVQRQACFRDYLRDRQQALKADADVVAAMWFLREHACKPITIPQVAKTLGVSRRTLERAFMRHVGHSPAAEITRARLERAKELLIGTDLSLPVVARQTGFFRAETLHRAFKKHAGITPGEYRRAHRAHSQRSPRPLRQTRSR